MEKKTIGGFIATLRKANGMTQKELAEQLNVSDKTISRWERDEGVPDLSVIPVLAEIFQVSCDELLRGERKPITERVEEKEEVTTAKGEKQKQRILTVSLSKCKTRSFIAMGIAGAGLIGAMIGNFGFLRAYIGFFVGTVFYLASVICEAVFVNGAFLSVADDDLNGEEVGRFKGAVIRLAEGTFGLIAVLLGASLPLIIFPHDTYVGLSGEAWLLYGALFGVVTLIIYSIICNVLNARLLERGVYCLGQKAQQKYWSNHALKKKCAFILMAILIGTYMVHALVLNRWDAVSLAEGTEFHDYESFIAYMEQDIPYYHSYTENGQYTVEVEKVIPDSTTYYNEFGDEISEEEALREVIKISDGTEEGKVVCEYIARNEMVSSIHYTEKDGSILPITVLTYDEVRAGQAKLNMINALFMAVYCMEAVGAMLFYFKKREK